VADLNGRQFGLEVHVCAGWVHPDYYRYLFKPVGGMLAASVAVLIGLLWAIRAGRSILAKKWGRRGGLAVALLLGLWCVVQAVTLVQGYRHAEQHPPGMEYQVTDDVENADATLLASHRSAALYDLFPPSAPAAAKAGEFHRSRVLVRGEQVEHWLDGQKVLNIALTHRT